MDGQVIEEHGVIQIVLKNDGDYYIFADGWFIGVRDTLAEARRRASFYDGRFIDTYGED